MLPRCSSAAAQERTRVERQADAYANRRTAEARRESAARFWKLRSYRARVVNEAWVKQAGSNVLGRNIPQRLK